MPRIGCCRGGELKQKQILRRFAPQDDAFYGVHCILLTPLHTVSTNFVPVKFADGQPDHLYNQPQTASAR